MSRSYRKHPFGGICSPGTEKWAKSKANRKLRHINKSEVFHGDEVFTQKREASDVWGFPKDGKMEFPYPQKDSHTVWMSRFYGITEEEALERERKLWHKFMRK